MSRTRRTRLVAGKTPSQPIQCPRCRGQYCCIVCWGRGHTENGPCGACRMMGVCEYCMGQGVVYPLPAFQQRIARALLLAGITPRDISFMSRRTLVPLGTERAPYVGWRSAGRNRLISGAAAVGLIRLLAKRGRRDTGPIFRVNGRPARVGEIAICGE